MKVIIVGGTGTIGKAVVKELSKRHTIIIAAYQHGDIRVDITDNQSIEKMFQSAGKVDAVISTTGKLHFGEFSQMTTENFQLGLNSKLMGQVNLVLKGLPYMNDAGSFTLTSGILSHDPIRFGCSASMVNAALDGFVKGAAIEMPRGIRINVVSPTILEESLPDYGDFFHGFVPVSAAKVALAFSKSVDGLQTGQVYNVS
ncbi:MAG: short chain dehydrogenase [Proteobacteria bacterium]|nr:short chain dehydrogenase [Pseudomonadota bacterium]